MSYIIAKVDNRSHIPNSRFLTTRGNPHVVRKKSACHEKFYLHENICLLRERSSSRNIYSRNKCCDKRIFFEVGWSYACLPAGVFLIPYFLVLLVCGVPLLYMELIIGQFTRRGPIGALGQICPLFKGNPQAESSRENKMVNACRLEVWLGMDLHDPCMNWISVRLANKLVVEVLSTYEMQKASWWVLPSYKIPLSGTYFPFVAA